MPTWISHEPAVWAGAISAILEALVASGVLQLSPEAQTAIALAIPAVAAIIVRANVVPNAKLATPAEPGAPVATPPVPAA